MYKDMDITRYRRDLPSFDFLKFIFEFQFTCLIGSLCFHQKWALHGLQISVSQGGRASNSAPVSIVVRTSEFKKFVQILLKGV